MKSKTKTKLSKELINEIVKKQFNIEVLDYKELKGGMMNSAYRIVLKEAYENQKEIILKVSVAPDTEILTYEQNIMKAEVSVYEKLRDRDIPVPKILGYDFSKSMIENDYFFMTVVEGTTWNKANKKLIKENRAALLYELGRYQAAIHSVRGSYFGYLKDDEMFRFQTWYDAFYSMMNNIIMDGKKKNVKLPYEAILTAVKQRKELLNEIKTPQVVDYDLWAGNVFLQEADGKLKISGIIDFERAFYGDCYADFTASMLIYTDVKKEEEFKKGYREAGGNIDISNKNEERMILYRMYMAVILAVETYRYNKLYACIVKAMAKVRIKKYLLCLNES